MTVTSVLVGAYAALPASEPEKEQFYGALAATAATGLEIPFRNGLVDDEAWLAKQLQGRFTNSVITLIPGTMGRLATDPTFGLASTSQDGRSAAIDYVRQAQAAAERLNQATGERTVRYLHIHSAPTAAANKEALARSLAELAEAGGAAEPVLEHCDAYSPDIAGEKRFLDLASEIECAKGAGIAVTVNWGRSVIEAHEAARAQEHIEALASAGVLRGLMFSGAGPSENQYGGPWADAHLPMREDEPTSLLDVAEVRACLAAAGAGLGYAGAKIQAPAGADVATRVAMIDRICAIIAAR